MTISKCEIPRASVTGAEPGSIRRGLAKHGVILSGMNLGFPVQQVVVLDLPGSGESFKFNGFDSELFDVGFCLDDKAFAIPDYFFQQVDLLSCEFMAMEKSAN